MLRLCRSLFLATLTLPVLGANTFADDDCGCDQGDPRLDLQVPALVPLGGSDQITLYAQGGNTLGLLMASTTCGSIQTPYGEICVGFPLIGQALVKFPPTEYVYLPFTVPNDPALDCLTLHLQFLVCDNFKASSSLEDMTFGNGICDGDFCTYTPGGWGAPCNGNNPGCLRDQNFDALFPGGLVLGDQDGADGDGEYALVLTSAAAVEAFLPQGSTGGTLAMDETDPTDSSAGVFAGQLAAAKLNLAFDDAGLLGGASLDLGDLEFVDCVDADLIGVSVRDLIDMADDVISGKYGICVGGGSCAGDDIVDADGDGNADVSLRDIQEALDALNNNFDGCVELTECLGLPSGT